MSRRPKSAPEIDEDGNSVYTVREGETLFDIARDQLGKASRWEEIYDLNQDELGETFNRLKPGMKLILPEVDAGGAPLSAKSRSTSRR